MLGQDALNVAALQRINESIAAPFPIESERVKASGIEVYSGRHLVLYTRAVDREAALDLISAFDAAVPRWCEYFQIPPQRAADWKIRAFLIGGPGEISRFRDAGLFQADLPEFAAGFQRDHNLWLFSQPGNYYTRHLLLHEGTHAFMQWFTRGYGAPWYSEGMAELLGVHHWNEGKLELGFRLRNRNQAEYWGRVRLIKDEYRAGVAMTLDDVLAIPADAFRDVRFYAWSWAGCEFFSHHPVTSKAFAALKSQTTLNAQSFNQGFRTAIEADWTRLTDDWALFVSEMEYGYEVDRGRIHLPDPSSHSGAGDRIELKSDQGWQVTTIEVKPGDRLHVTASGRFQVGSTEIPADPPAATRPLPWMCEANGITIQYYRDRPLGMLEYGVWNPGGSTVAARVASLIQPGPVGQQAEIEIPTAGILCFRINESPAHLDDNQGALEVVVKRVK